MTHYDEIHGQHTTHNKMEKKQHNVCNDDGQTKHKNGKTNAEPRITEYFSLDFRYAIFICLWLSQFA